MFIALRHVHAVVAAPTFRQTGVDTHTRTPRGQIPAGMAQEAGRKDFHPRREGPRPNTNTDIFAKGVGENRSCCYFEKYQDGCLIKWLLTLAVRVRATRPAHDCWTKVAN